MLIFNITYFYRPPPDDWAYVAKTVARQLQRCGGGITRYALMKVLSNA